MTEFTYDEAVWDCEVVHFVDEACPEDPCAGYLALQMLRTVAASFSEAFDDNGQSRIARRLLSDELRRCNLHVQRIEDGDGWVAEVKALSGPCHDVLRVSVDGGVEYDERG